MSEVHGTCGLYSEAHASQYFPRMHYPEELVLCGGLVEQSNLLIHKESVRHPDQSDVLRTNDYHTDLHILSIGNNKIIIKEARQLRSDCFELITSLSIIK